MSSLAWLQQILQDMRFGVRTLRKNPAFAMIAVVTLALGIGANTAVFSVVEGVVLAPLPYPRSDRLVMVSESRPNVKQLAITYPDFQDWQRDARSFEQMAAFNWRDYELTQPGTSEHLKGLEVSSGFFATLGVKPILGRDSLHRKTDRTEHPPRLSAIDCGETDLHRVRRPSASR